MGKLRYLASRVGGANYKQMLDAAREVKRRTGRGVLRTMSDMAICGVKYQAGYMDYLVFEFYKLAAHQRATYITRGVNNGYVQALNDRAYWPVFSDKIKTLQTFAPYVGRGWIDLQNESCEAFAAFVKACDRFVVKPVDGTCGRGIAFYTSAQVQDIPALYESLRKDRLYLAEAFIRQHPQMNALYPDAVNTLRIVTIAREGEVHFVFCSIRIGNGKTVDNLNSGGMASVFDPDTGCITKPAADKAGEVYTTHPITGTEIVGFVIPMATQAIELVRRLAVVVPEVAYVGWDIAISEDGPVFVEANQFPGHDIYQFQAHLEKDLYGLKPRFDAAAFGSAKKQS